LYSYKYVVFGVCISTSTGGSVMYSWNSQSTSVTGSGGSVVPANGVVLDTWASSNCVGTQTSTNVLQASAPRGSLTTYTYYPTLPTVPGTSANTR
jgi:hypothetical protein